MSLAIRWMESIFGTHLDDLGGWRGVGVRTGRTLFLAVREFRSDACFERAAGLTFATIVSLFPLGILFVTIAGSIGEGDEVIRYVEREVIPSLAPEFSDSLVRWLDETISRKAFQSWRTDLISVLASLGLLLSALGVLVTAERVFNRIWKVPGRRTYLQKLTTFWVILTTSPLMILASMALGDFLVPEGGILRRFTESYPALKQLHALLVPTMVGFLAFGVAYLFLPTARVRVASAAAGALVAAILWEASKRGFYLYVWGSGRDTNFYRQIAAVPLFLIWIYITWVVILLGGEVSYTHQNQRLLSRMFRRTRERRRASPSFAGIYVLARIAGAFETGAAAPGRGELAEELGVEESELSSLIAALVDGGLLVENASTPGAYVLARHPRTVRLADVVRELWQEELAPAPSPPGAQAVGVRVEEAFRRGRGAFLDTLGDLTLQGLVAAGSHDASSASASAAAVPASAAAAGETRTLADAVDSPP